MNLKQTRELLEPYLVGSQEVSPGEWDMKCPLHDDKKRSARVNFDKELWRCFAGCGGGNLAGLVRRMKKEVPASKQRRASGKRAVVSLKPEQVDRWHSELMKDENAKQHLWMTRGLDEETMIRFRIGYDQASRAFVIPVYLSDGSLYNARKYRPNAPADKKIWWAVKKDPNTTVPIFNEEILDHTSWVVICEGEMDAIIASQNNFPAVSGTAGAATWHIEWSERFKDKEVWIAYDRDTQGEKGAKMVAEYLEQFATAIFIVKIPLNKKGADVTDYFTHPHSEEDFTRLLRKAKRYQVRSPDPMNMEPIPVSVMDSFDSQNINRSQGMDVLILGRSKETYALPKVVESTCTMDAGPKCKFCPMLARKGKYRFSISPSSQVLLDIKDSSDAQQGEALRKHVRALRCDRLSHEVKSHQTVEELYVRPSWDEHQGDFTPRKINSVGKHDTMPSQVVHVTGTTLPDPKSQRNEFLAWEVAEAENAIDEFRVTPDIVRTLKQFRPRADQTPLQRLGDIATDFEQRVTRIYGRLDLHVLIDLVYHSLISFPFQGKLERRGWLDALVVGDTRTGKSEVAQRVLEHYRTGQFVNCEAATFAGVIGGLQQMADRQWAVTWGIVPMSDRRLVVLDEASGLTQEEIQKMSDVRSRGIIKMAKIQADQAWARTRLVWLSNPRDESMEKYMHGIQAIQPLIGNREDIARFDIAMAMNSQEVDRGTIYQRPSRRPPRFTSEDCHTRVLWAWSRTADDVEWDKAAERDVFRASEMLGEEFISNPPLIQAANAHVKVARVAAAIASSVFSSDSSGRRVIVKREHVQAAKTFIDYLYSKPTFGYRSLSIASRDQARRAASNAGRAKQYLMENRMLIEFLQSSQGGQFRPDMLTMMLNISPPETNAIIGRLNRWGLISHNSSYINLNPALHQLLREIQEEGL